LATLTGVGPTTATLLLSVRDPTRVPFFQDELFHWLCGSGRRRSDGGPEKVEERKLKYSIKEYKELFEAVAALRQRLDGRVSAEQVEKVGFVVGHLDVLEAAEAEGLKAVLAGHVGAEATTSNNNNNRVAKRVGDKASSAATEKETTTMVAGTKPSGGRKKGKRDGTPPMVVVTAPSRKRKAAEPPASSTRKSQRSR
jgi:hypothetical protein